jgi:hypothetical protein
MSISTYHVADYLQTDKFVEVTFSNDSGLVLVRNVNIPHLESGLVDNHAFHELLEEQVNGINNKIALGVITLVEPVGVSSV